jgi:hypothetical protein
MNKVPWRAESSLWRTKCHEIIYKLSEASYRQANYLPNGRKRKRHVPYTVPALAEELVDCLYKDDEHRAKSLFHYFYCGNLDEFI